MSPESVATEALVLRRFDYSETSQVAHLLTRELGRVAVLAKGIKRPASSLRGPLDLMALSEVTIRLRRGGGLHLLSAHRVRTGFPGLRRSLPRLWGGFYVIEVLREGTREMLAVPELFDLGVETLAALEGAPRDAVPRVLCWFDLHFLAASGFLPAFDRCTTCGRVAPESGPVRFAPVANGLLCRACAPRRPLRVATFDLATRKALVLLLETPDAAAAGALEIPLPVVALLRRVLPRTLEHQFEKELRAIPFVLVEDHGRSPYGGPTRPNGASTTAS